MGIGCGLSPPGSRVGCARDPRPAGLTPVRHRRLRKRAAGHKRSLHTPGAALYPRACGFSFPGGGGSIEPLKTGGGGFGKRAQLTGTINQSL